MQFRWKSILLSTLTALALTAQSASAFTVFGLLPEENQEKWYIQVKAAPGMEVPVAFYVQNNSQDEAWINVEARDALIQNEVYIGMETKEDAKNSFGKWTTLDESKVIVPGRTKILVKGTVKIPEETPLGDYWGAFAGVEQPPEELKSASGETNGAKINTVGENGVRVLVHVVTPEEAKDVQTVQRDEVEPQSIEKKSAGWLPYAGASALVIGVGAWIAVRKKS